MDRTNIQNIWIEDNAIWIETTDGHRGCEYLSDYPQLSKSPAKDLENYTLSFYGMHWPELDQDLSFDGFFAKTGMPITMTGH